MFFLEFYLPTPMQLQGAQCFVVTLWMNEIDNMMTTILQPLNLKFFFSSSFSHFNSQHLTSYPVIWQFQVLRLHVILLFKTMALFSTGGYHIQLSKGRMFWLLVFMTRHSSLVLRYRQPFPMSIYLPSSDLSNRNLCLHLLGLS